MGFVPKKPESVSFEKVSKRSRGRPRKIEILPENPLMGQLQKKRETHLKKNSLLKKLRKNSNSLDVLDQMIQDLAEEAAILSFEREELSRQGKDTTVTSGKRISALKTSAELFFKKRDAVLDQAFDFKSKRFEKLIEWLLIKVVQASALEAGMSEEQINILFDNIGKKFDDDRWTEDAMGFIKS